MKAAHSQQTPSGGSDRRLVRCSCGSQCFERVTPIRGTWREYVVFDDDGTENVDKSESTTDDLIHGKPPKTMKCGECGKRAPNPDTPNVQSVAQSHDQKS